jgi:hypothetical protein
VNEGDIDYDDEYAKNDETSPRLAKKYENCAS